MATAVMSRTHEGMLVRSYRDQIDAKGAILLANRSGARMLNNDEFDNRLVRTDIWREKCETFLLPANTGTLFAHAQKGGKLGATVEHSDWVLRVPDEARGERNVILAVNHGFTQDGTPIIQLHNEGRFTVVEIADPKAIRIIGRFPEADGHYIPDKEFGIPVGPTVLQSSDARYLWRTPTEKIGLVVRGQYHLLHEPDNWRSVELSHNLTQPLGMLAVLTQLAP
jgi:hypothetical protein